MQTSRYVTAVPAILADMEQSREEADNHQPDQEDEPGSEAVEKLYVYRTDNGGWLASPTRIGEKDLTTEDDQPQAPIVESRVPQTGTRPATRHDPPYFLHFLLLLFIFIGFDNIDSVFAQFAPTASVTITPVVKTITTSATYPIGAGKVQGRVLPTLTLTQSQTVAATGKGHQDAQYASGTLTLYNGQLQSITIASGTLLTGRDGAQIVTTETATIPAADPSTTPPTYGHVDVSARAVHKGAQGNIAALDLSGPCCDASVIVKNLAPFANGQDARDFAYVQSSDIRQATSALTSMLLQSEQGALSGQLQPGETLTTPACTPSVFSNHHPNDEAASVAVTVSETCKAIAYSQQSLQQAAVQLVHGRLRTLNASYQLIGPVQVTVHSVSTQNGMPTLTTTIHGVWVYQINEKQIQSLVAGKPRLEAIQLLRKLPGVQTVSITGISDNQQLPTDTAHIHLSIFYLAS